MAVAELIGNEFVAVVEQVGDFTTSNVNGEITKTGGNVASYFCTASGRVINGVLGPVDADELVREAQWAIDAFDEVRHSTFDRQVVHIRHQRATYRCSGDQKNQQLAHLFQTRPLPYLDDIYNYVFRRILNEKLSNAGLTVAQAEQKMELARETGRPLLFVIHEQKGNDFDERWEEMVRGSRAFDRNVRKLVADYIVIAVHKDQQAALSQKLKQPPYESRNGWPLFVVTDTDGKQIDSVSGGWFGRSVGKLLATNWIEAIGERELSTRKVRLARVVHEKLGHAPHDRFKALLAKADAKRDAG